ncbi:chaperone NapD [Thalassotalea crassostreae]|uniref:chaperone NapD n=1 Tax=Thalassotalea crassostreae TaxID=1763536 RepID=UPI000839A72C|nr:chaperone NapD [Thalassotalea crassostreae]
MEQPVKTNEYHVASFIAQIDISQKKAVEESILSTPGAEIHATSDTGKIVFTIEADNQKKIGKYADIVRDQAGIFTLAPVYHQYLEE